MYLLSVVLIKQHFVYALFVLADSEFPLYVTMTFSFNCTLYFSLVNTRVRLKSEVYQDKSCTVEKIQLITSLRQSLSSSLFLSSCKYYLKNNAPYVLQVAQGLQVYCQQYDR